MTTESKKLQTTLAADGRTLLDCSPFAVASGEANRVAGIAPCRHDARIAHEMLPVLRKLVGAVQADGCLPDGYCFCPENRDAHKAEHVGECRDLREALTAAAPFLED